MRVLKQGLLATISILAPALVFAQSHQAAQPQKNVQLAQASSGDSVAAYSALLQRTLCCDDAASLLAWFDARRVLLQVRAMY